GLLRQPLDTAHASPGCGLPGPGGAFLPVFLPGLDRPAHLRQLVPQRIPAGQDVAADLDLTGAPAVAPWPAFRWAGCALAGLGLFVVVLWLTGWVAGVVLGFLAAGWGVGSAS